MSSDHDDLELRWHPGDPRLKPRFVRLSRRSRRALVVALSAWGLLLVVGLATAPRMVDELLSDREYRAQLARRTQSGQRLQALVARLEELASAGREELARVEKIHALYGLVASDLPVPTPRARPATVESIFAATLARGAALETELTAALARGAVLVAEAEAFERQNGDLPARMPVASPVPGEDWVPTSRFGTRRSPFTQELEFHTGLDLAARAGMPILAAGDGVVVFAGEIGADRRRSTWWQLGTTVVVRHTERILSIYGHCARLDARVGATVRRGQKIAEVGTSGWATTPLLHFAVWRRPPGGDFAPVDPLEFLLELGAEESPAGSPEGAGAPPEFEPIPRAFRG